MKISASKHTDFTARSKGTMYKSIILAAALLFGITASGQSKKPSDGEIRLSDSGATEAWDALGKQWVGPEDFWMRYAERRGGLTWGRRADYPAYEDVSELDTLIIETDKGPCLMEFFHTRWRRANDVRRWDDEFNKYGGCPHVFD